MTSLYGREAEEAPSCNGLCITGYDVGIISPGVAYAHPDCELHAAHRIGREEDL